MTPEQPEYMDITPTPAGYAAFRQLFEESVESYQRELAALKALQLLVKQTTFGDDERQNTYIHTFVAEQVEAERERITASLTSLKKGLEALRQSGY